MKMKILITLLPRIPYCTLKRHMNFEYCYNQNYKFWFCKRDFHVLSDRRYF